MSLPTCCRIRKKTEFLRVQDLSKSSGKKLYGKFFLLLVAQSESDCSRLGITVTLKIDKRAVVRNKIKRRVREAFKQLLAKLRQPLDVVVIARQGAGDRESNQILLDLSDCLRRGGYIA